MNSIGDEYDKESYEALVIKDAVALNRFSPEWNEVLKSSNANSIFLTWEWIENWLRSLFSKACLFVVIVRDQQKRIIAIAPFYYSILRLLNCIPYRCLRILGDRYSGGEYPDIILRKNYEIIGLKVVSQVLMENRRDWDCIWVPNVSGWNGAGDRWIKLGESLPVYMNLRKRRFSYISFKGSYEDYLERFSASRRKSIRYERRKLLKEHHARFMLCKDHESLTLFLSRLFELHQKRWRSLQQDGSFVRQPMMQVFYQTFATLALHQDWLRCYALEVDGQIQAVQYGYFYNNIFYALQEGFEPDGPTSIGNVLRNYVMQACIDEGVHIYDFLGGYSQHKKRWGAVIREGYDLFLGKQNIKIGVLFGRNFLNKKIWPTGRFLRQEVPLESV